MSNQDKQAEIDFMDTLMKRNSYLFESGRKAREKQLRLLSLQVPEGERILDAGCGPGTYGILLAQQGQKVLGVDISLKAVIEARLRAEQMGADFSAVVGDLEHLPFENDSFQLCFCAYALHHFPDVNPIVAELARVLKPGGTLVLLEPNGSSLAVRISHAFEERVHGWLVRTGADTPNEMLHSREVYLQALENESLFDFQVRSFYAGGLPPLPPRPEKGARALVNFLLLHTVARLRHLFFLTAVRVLPRPLNGIDLAIIARKPDGTA